MSSAHRVFALLFPLVLVFGNVHACDDKVDFKAVKGFPTVPSNIQLGRCSGVDVDKQGNVYLFHRAKDPIICFDSHGHVIRTWGNEVIKNAHGLRIDAEGHIWVTDLDTHQVYKYTPKGKLLLTLGKKGEAGLATDQFDKPTDVAFGAKGELYVSDGYGNSRVMKFAADGKFLKTWGTPGTNPGEFDTPHTILVNDLGWVIVGDRENERVQVFDPEGVIINIWSGYKPFGLAFDPTGTIFVADGKAHQVLQLSKGGEVVDRWGKEGTGPGEFKLPHMLASDSQGNLYVAEILSNRMQKLERISGKPSS